jgi:hypothetical protein
MRVPLPTELPRDALPNTYPNFSVREQSSTHFTPGFQLFDTAIHGGTLDCTARITVGAFEPGTDSRTIV